MSTNKKLSALAKKEREEKFKIQPFEQPENIDKKNYVRLTHYLLHHKNFIALSSTSKIVLIYMRDWAFGSADYWHTGKFEFSSTMLENINVASRSKTMRAFIELREKGFINAEYRHGAGAINRWSFSDRWYTGQKEPFPEIDDYVSVKNTQKYKQK